MAYNLFEPQNKKEKAPFNFRYLFIIVFFFVRYRRDLKLFFYHLVPISPVT